MYMFIIIVGGFLFVLWDFFFFLVEKPKNHYPGGRFSHRRNWLHRLIFSLFMEYTTPFLKRKRKKGESKTGQFSLLY